MSIFPSNTINIDDVVADSISNINKELPMFREYAYDFIENKFVTIDGRNIVMEGNEALKIWVYKNLKTPRFRYQAYTWNYGHELEGLIGTSLSKAAIESEAKRYIEECLLINPYILSIEDLNINIDGDRVEVSFTINTIYGEVDIVVS